MKAAVLFTLYVVDFAQAKHNICTQERKSKKTKKKRKKVLTKRVPRGIIYKRSRETAKNRKRKAEREAA